MLNHPGQPISIHDVAEIVRNAFPLAFTPKNIQSGFQMFGICPFNRNIFTDDEFLSSYAMDRES